MLKCCLLIVFIWTSVVPSIAQIIRYNHIDDIQLSVITCGAGEDLYTLFGHSALRVKDTVSGQDIVFNWGTFDFGDPGLMGTMKFGLNFLSGQLPYKLSATSSDSFLREYLYYERSVNEQLLHTSDVEKRDIIIALEENMQSNNVYYKYDFYFDNCTTRIRDILENSVSNLSFQFLSESPKAFRTLLHENLNNHPWTKFGMNIVLGTLSDRPANMKDEMFLPAYFESHLDQSMTGDSDLVSVKNKILKFDSKPSPTSWWTPLRLFSVLLIIESIGFFLYYISGDLGFLRWYDFLWFSALGIASIVFISLWVGTDHAVCRNNWNLLWGGPWVILTLCNNEVLKRIGYIITALGAAIVIGGWSFIPQGLSTGVLAIACVSVLKSLRGLGLRRWLDGFRKPHVVAVMLILCTCQLAAQEKIGGITLVAPPNEYPSDPMTTLKEANAGWVALVPYAFSRPGQPEVRFGSDRQWWGERTEGIRTSLELAQKNGLQVMLKPQVWMPGGWVGEMDFDRESDWQEWEKGYKEYIMTFAKIAAEYNVALLCIGTEYRISVKKREAFWRSLIKEIRSFYKGQLTYSSNWDSYDKVPIWDALDYVGISAYFPLSDLETPPVMLLSYRWNKYNKRLKKLSERLGKKILFTEYGYLSVDGAAGKTWELEKKVKSLDINEVAQRNGYEALLGTFWNKDYWAGGFLWKWFPHGQGHEGYPERDYTPQNKKALEVIKKWYGKNSKI